MTMTPVCRMFYNINNQNYANFNIAMRNPAIVYSLQNKQANQINRDFCHFTNTNVCNSIHVFYNLISHHHDMLRCVVISDTSSTSK